MATNLYDEWRRAHGSPHPATREVCMGVDNREVFEDLDSMAKGLAASLRAKTGWDGEIDCVLNTYVSADGVGKASVIVRAWVPKDIADRFDHQHTQDCWEMSAQGYKCKWLREANDE